MKPGRNDPCRCGSGTKYKKCHLASDEGAPKSESAESPLPVGDPLHRRLAREVLDGTKRWHKRADVLEATQLYFGKHPSEREPDPDAMDGFLQWYIWDFRPAGTQRTAVEEYLNEADSGLSPREREMLESWRDARFGLYEVEAVEEGRGIWLTDLCSDDRFFVHDVSSSRALVQWDCVVNRVEHFEGKWLFAGNGMLVPRPVVPELLSRVAAKAEKAGQSSGEFLRANIHKIRRLILDLHEERIAGLQVVNFEGDPLEVSIARYRILDEPGLLTALRSVPEFEETTRGDENPEVRSFGWLETGVRESRRSYGTININEGQLELDCNSRQRLTKGRQLLERHAGQSIMHLKDSFKNLNAIKREMKKAPEVRDSGVPLEVEKELLQRLRAEHYAKWPDEPLPALGGQTARSAVQTADGREAVLELIQTMENSEARAGRQGRPAYSFLRLREELGLQGE